jgi:hypothetical protein
LLSIPVAWLLIAAPAILAEKSAKHFLRNVSGRKIRQNSRLGAKSVYFKASQLINIYFPAAWLLIVGGPCWGDNPRNIFFTMVQGEKSVKQGYLASTST